MTQPGWDYEDYPEHKHLLPRRATKLLIYLRSKKLNANHVCEDNRPQHLFLFESLTPDTHSYFAGNYRGSDYPGLLHYEVQVKSDPRVGVKAALVNQAMRHFRTELKSHLLAINEANAKPNASLTAIDKFLYLVRAACKFFVEFLRVHPYANGNGHMARFFIFSFLAIFDIWPKKWPLDDRPPDPPYSYLIKGTATAILKNSKSLLFEQLLDSSFCQHIHITMAYSKLLLSYKRLLVC